MVSPISVVLGLVFVGDRWLGMAGLGRRRGMRELERVMVREESNGEF